MRNIFIFIGLFSLILTVSPAQAEELNAVSEVVENVNQENEQIVNDEGYGTDDKEYYEAEEQVDNAEMPVVNGASN